MQLQPCAFAWFNIRDLHYSFFGLLMMVLGSSLKETRLTAKMISSEAEREVKTIRSTHGDTMADMEAQLENALAELKSTQETLDRVRKESNRKTEAIESLTVKCSKLTLELRMASPRLEEDVGSAAP